MKLLHVIGAAALILAIAGVEGGAFTCLQGVAVAISGAVLMLLTMNQTGWYYAKEKSPAVREHRHGDNKHINSIRL